VEATLAIVEYNTLLTTYDTCTLRVESYPAGTAYYLFVAMTESNYLIGYLGSDMMLDVGRRDAPSCFCHPSSS
jgi:hypothetical protein